MLPDSTWSWPLLLVLICHTLTPITLSSSLNNISRVSYFSFVSNLKSTFRSYETTQQQQQTDSSLQLSSHAILKYNLGAPLATLQIPFDFLLFGRLVRALFISPFGGLFLQPHNPCQPQNIFLVLEACSLLNSHFGLIGGLYGPILSDTSNSSEFFSYSDGSSVTIAFQNVSIFNIMNTSNSFRISIFNDSRIELQYDRIGSNLSSLDQNHWLSGIRSPENDPYTYYTSVQRAFADSEWNYQLDGVYPDRATVVSGQQFNICPVSRDWCLSPSQLSTADNPVEVVIELRSLLISCIDMVNYAIRLIDNEGQQNYTISCNATASSGLVPAQLLCTHRHSAEPLDAGVYTVQVVWQIADSASNFSILPIDGLMMNITEAASSAMLSDCSSSDGGFLSTNTSHCDACSLCEGSADICLAATSDCFTSNSTDFVDAYTNLDCTGNCTEFNTNTDTVDELFYEGVNGSCCQMADIDCNGECNGGGRITKAEESIANMYGEHYRYCCAGQFTVDCDGFCQGTPAASYNVCGTCGGSVTDPCNCYPVSTSDLLFSRDDGLEGTFDAVFDASGGIDEMEQTFFFHLENNSTKDLLVVLSIDGQELFSPTVSVSESNVTIPAGTAPHQFSIRVSVKELFRGNVAAWEVKRFLIGFLDTRAEQLCTQASLFSITDITVNSIECDHINNADTCRRMPGCSLCLENDGMRLLRAYEGNTNVRQLFTEFIPISMILDDDYSDIVGECRTGFDPQSACPKSLADTANAASSGFDIISSKVVIVLLCLTVSILSLVSVS